MANLKIQRKTLTGNSEAFTFDVSGSKFLVKNLSEADCFVNFEAITNANENTSILIPKKTAQIVLSNENPIYGAKTIYVKGTGIIEVQVILW